MVRSQIVKMGSFARKFDADYGNVSSVAHLLFCFVFFQKKMMPIYIKQKIQNSL